MAVTYRVDFENTSGSTVAVFQDFRSLNFTKIISAKGSYQLTLSGFDSRIIDIGDDYVIRVWMTDPTFGIDWLNVFNGLHKTFTDALLSNGNRTYTSYGPSLEELLEKTYILYPTGSSQATKSDIASTVMLAYVGENAGSSGDATRDTPVQDVLSLGADPILGGTWSGSKPRKHLLTTIREISDFTRENNLAIVDKVDFRVNYLDNYLFEFECGQLGRDLTTDGLGADGLNGAGNAPIIFSAELGNIQSERLSKSRYNEANTVVALGQGYRSDRRVEVAINADSVVASPVAQREVVINSAQSDTSADLAAAAQARLQEMISKPNFSFTPFKGSTVLFRDYFVGDFVTAEDFRTKTRSNKQLRAVTVNVNFSPTRVENISTEFEDVNP